MFSLKVVILISTLHPFPQTIDTAAVKFTLFGQFYRALEGILFLIKMGPPLQRTSTDGSHKAISGTSVMPNMAKSIRTMKGNMLLKIRPIGVSGESVFI